MISQIISKASLLGTILLLQLGHLTAQTYCDSIEIIDMKYAILSDSHITISVKNTSSNIISYPGFILYDQQGDTIAKETVNYFGIGTAPQSHFLRLKPNMPLTDSVVGSLQLWSAFYSQLECTYPVSAYLCPADTCTMVYLSFGNFGGAMINDTFNWVLLKEGVQISNGAFELNALQQGEEDTVCLSPGDYALIVQSDFQGGGQPFFGVNDAGFGIGSVSRPFHLPADTIVFSVYKKCNGIAGGLHEIRPEFVIDLVYINGDWHLHHLKGSAIGEIRVFDLLGRLVLSKTETNSHFVLNKNLLNGGIYILTVDNIQNSQSWKVPIADY